MKPATPFHLTNTPLARGASLIEASAGTGKTYAITALFVRLIIEENLSVREILTVTYTEAATEELRDRVREALVLALKAFASGATQTPFLSALVARYGDQTREMKARLENALCDFDEAPIYTIHGFCQRTLRDRAFESGLLFDTELVTDPTEFLQEIADDFWRKHFYETGRSLVHFALKNKFSPQRFLDLLRTCTNYPRIEFISQAKGRPLASLSAELESCFQAAREVWLSDADKIKACFGSASNWGNSPYNNDEAMAELFQQFNWCFSGGDTAFEALKCIADFCTASLKEGKRKRGRAPVPTQRFFDLCEKVCQAEKTWLAGLQLAFVEFARTELPRRKAERKIQYYDDLLTRLDTALSGPGGKTLAEDLQARYRAALIDEFQDTDPVQYSIFHRAFSGGKTFLFLIGDPKQAIYGFRGADIFTYLEASEQAARRFSLSENWRSETGLVTAVNTVFGAAPNSFVFERIRFQEVAPRGAADAEPLTLDDRKPSPFQLWFCKRTDGKDITKAQATNTLPPVVAGEIVRLLNGNAKIGKHRLKPEDIAVLVLENKQAEKVQEALSKVNVPSVLHTTASLFQSHEAAELYRVLAGIALPGDERLVKSALATDLFGVDGSQLSECSEAQWQDWLQLFHEYADLWSRHGFFRMFCQWLHRQQVRQRLLAFTDGERRLTNILHLGEVLHQAETERRLGISGLQKWLAERMAAETEASEEHQLRLERDDNAVRIVTVHKSKGLEYPVVFCLFAWRGSEIMRNHEDQVFFHDPEQGNKLVRDLGPDVAEEHKEQARLERLAENVRLLYVALTRAKHRCYLAWGAMKGAATSAPAWLLHRPPGPAGWPLPVAAGILPAVKPDILPGGSAAPQARGPVGRMPPSTAGKMPAATVLQCPDAPGLLETLQEHFNKLSDEALLADLASLAEKSDGALVASDLPDTPAARFEPEDSTAEKLACRQFKGRIQRDWVISSFTYFHAGLHQELPDRDAVIAPAVEEEPATEGMSAFPRGPKAGICLHEILERLDFRATDTEMLKLVDDRLQAHGIALPVHREAVHQMLKALLRFRLAQDRADFTLANIAAEDRLNEVEFYFPVRGVSPARLQSLLGKLGWTSAVPTQLGRLAFDPVQGFLNGFIDLVFRFEGRFYLVDWKSNWVGNRLHDYSAGAIKGEMLRHHYFMQYHLYTVALHKYLGLRVPGYDYEQHFGGVIYLFLRGLDPQHPERGAFRDLPSRSAVDRLSTLLSGNE
jgi:exodeoxyribonuclease V beta subunit